MIMALFNKIVENIKDNFYIGWHKYEFEDKHYIEPYILKFEIRDWVSDNINLTHFNYSYNECDIITKISFKNSKDFMFFKLRWG
jgi:hypothetical protein